jgi:periplasmic protein TonB
MSAFRLRLILGLASGVAHAIAFVSLGDAATKSQIAVDSPIEIVEAPPPVEPPPPEPKPEPVEPEVVKPQPVAKAKAAAPAPEAEAAPASMDALPDLGLSLGGGGLAVASRAAGTNPSTVAKKVLAKELGKPVKAASSAAQCSDSSKPKPLFLPSPAYTAAGRSAGVEGKVRVRLSVDASGVVEQVTVLSGLGYGLDEAAVAAVKQAKFAPAIECGKAVPAVFTIAMRFSIT